MTKASERRILVVDDEPDVRFFLATFIEDAGFIVETASDGVEALEKLETFNPHLMTLDMVMPRKSGIRVMRKIRTMEKWAKLPVIVITAHAHDEFGSDDVKEFNAFTSGTKPRYIMEKPVTPAKLVAAIGDILGVELETIEETPKKGESEEWEMVRGLINGVDNETLTKIKQLIFERQ